MNPSMTIEQLAKMGPVRSVWLDEREQKMALREHDVKEKLKHMRALAEVSTHGQFRAYLERQTQAAFGAMLTSKSDEERRNSQALALVWTRISRDLVTAEKQVVELEEILQGFSGK